MSEYVHLDSSTKDTFKSNIMAYSANRGITDVIVIRIMTLHPIYVQLSRETGLRLLARARVDMKDIRGAAELYRELLLGTSAIGQIRTATLARDRDIPIEPDLLEELVDFKLQHLDLEINGIIEKRGYKDAAKFMEDARNGTLKEAEMDAISLRQLLADKEKLESVKARCQPG